MAASAAGKTRLPPGSVVPPARSEREPLAVAAQTIPVKATIEPTDRSIPAVRITNVIPTARMPMIDTCRSTFMTLRSVRNPGSRMERIKINPSRKISGAKRPRRSMKEIPFFCCAAASAALVDIDVSLTLP